MYLKLCEVHWNGAQRAKVRKGKQEFFISATDILSADLEQSVEVIMEHLKDKYNLVFWMVFLIGFTILLPWNILITVSGFWDYKFRNISQDGLEVQNSTTTDLQKLFASYVAIASNVPNATFIILHALIGHKFSMRLRLYGSQV